MTKEEKTKEEIRLLKEDLADKENIINGLADDLDAVLGKMYALEEIIAAWNSRFPDDAITTYQRKRPMSDYTMSDDEWKKHTRIPHPRDKKFNPYTGESQ